VAVTKAIDFLKAAMICWPAMTLPEKGNYNYLVRTDSSDFVIRATLQQLQGGTAAENRIITYFSRKLHDTKTCYSTYDTELLGIQDTIEHWQFYLKSGQKFRVQTDHSSLQYILGELMLTGRQMPLLETLQKYDFNIEYYPGAKNHVQDTLSRRTHYKDPLLP
jgi:hypothetical protein